MNFSSLCLCIEEAIVVEAGLCFLMSEPPTGRTLANTVLTPNIIPATSPTSSQHIVQNVHSSTHKTSCTLALKLLYYLLPCAPPILLQNSLPQYVQLSNTLPTFRQSLKTHYTPPPPVLQPTPSDYPSELLPFVPPLLDCKCNKQGHPELNCN